MSSEALAALRTAQPGLRVIPEVFHALQGERLRLESDMQVLGTGSKVLHPAGFAADPQALSETLPIPVDGLRYRVRCDWSPSRGGGPMPGRILSPASIAGFAAVCTVLWSVAPPSAGAIGGTFDYAVERVTIDGNMHGPHDGTPDIVEESFQQHTQPVLDAIWGFIIPFHGLFGTVQEIGGALHLMSPGTPLDLPEVGLSLNQSDVLSESALLRDAAGDAHVEVVFQPATLGVNHFVHATLALSGPGGPGVYAGLEFSNFDAAVAAKNYSPAGVGFSMSSHLVQGDLSAVTGQSLPVDPTSVGGAFVLALDYDDTAKTITPSYSLNGGQTFSGGFDPLPIGAFDGSGVGTAILIIGADPRTLAAPPPQCPPYLNAHAVTVVHRTDGSGTVSFRGRGLLDPRAGVTFNPVTEGAQLAVVDLAGPSVLVNLSGSTAVPPGARGSGCDPRDGWTAIGIRRFRYRNYSNAFPPACTSGSANGLGRMTVRLANTSVWKIDVAATVKAPTVPASITGPMHSLWVRGQGGNADQNGACLALQSADTPCKVGSTRVRCKY